jgi:hypothetical protein
MPEQNDAELKCGECGIGEAEHRELYHTGLGLLNFSFQPDQGSRIEGQLRLCRPCTHEVLSRRLLHAAGVREELLSPETWP